MRILLINDLGTPTGGAENDLILLRKTLRDQGHDVRLFTGNSTVADVNTLSDYTCFSTLNSGFATVVKVFNPFAVYQLNHVLSEFQPDVIHLRMFLDQLSPFILPAISDYPVVMHICDYRPICPIGTKTLPSGEPCTEKYGRICLDQCISLAKWLPLMAQMKFFLEKWMSSSNYVVACSKVVQAKLEANGIPVDQLIWQGSKPVNSAPSLPQLTGHPTLVYAGRFVWKKGIDTLLHAMPYILDRFPEATLKIIGFGPESINLQRLISELQMQHYVDIIDYMPNTELQKVLERTWLQILPSRWEEPFGIVMSEAMLRGTVFVAPPFGAPPEIIQHGENGILFSPYSPQGLAESIISLFEHPEEIERIRTNAQRFAVEKLNMLHEASSFLAVYERLLESRRLN